MNKDKVETAKKINLLVAHASLDILSADEIKGQYEYYENEKRRNDQEEFEREKINNAKQECVSRQYSREMGTCVITEDDINLLLYRINKIIENDENEHFTPEEKEYLAQSMMAMIKFCADECAPMGRKNYTKEDVYESCLIGFSKALAGYNKHVPNTTFSSYAYSSMRRAVIDMIRKEEGREEVPWETKGKRRVSSAGDRDEVCQTPETVSEEKRVNQRVIAGTVQKDIEKEFIKKEFVAELEQYLNDEEKFIMHHYYMDKTSRMTQPELAEFFHTDIATIRRKTANLMNKLRRITKMKNVKFEDFL